VSDIYFDSGVIVDALSGHPKAIAELRRAKRPWLCRTSWLEIVGDAPPTAREDTERFLANFSIREITPEIARRAANLRYEKPQIGLGAALVFAAAQEHGGILVTRNIKDFPAATPGIRIPYLV
jgi:predicted nucleic acid-binding protein